jgi:hypothetical protein
MRALPLLLCSLLVAGCATGRDDGFPSLARREAERVVGIVRPVEAPAKPTTVPPQTGSAIANLRRQALEAHRRFQGRRPAAAALAAAAQGAAVASESWSVAQVALADLDSMRSEAMIPLADLDRLYIVAATAAALTAGSAELDAVAAVRDEVSGWIAEEDAALAALRSRLRA